MDVEQGRRQRCGGDVDVGAGEADWNRCRYGRRRRGGAEATAMWRRRGDRIELGISEQAFGLNEYNRDLGLLQEVKPTKTAKLVT